MLVYAGITPALVDDGELEINDVAPPHNIITAGLITFPPFIEQHSDGNCTGSAVVDLQKIFAKKNYTLIIYCGPPTRIYRGFLEGRIDITINAKLTDIISENAIYSHKPYLMLEIMLYTGSNKTNNTIASIRGYNFDGARHSFEQQGSVFVDSANTKEAIAIFLRGSTNSLLSYRKPFEYYIAQGAKTNKYNKLNLTFMQQSLGFVPSYFAVNTMNQKADEIITIINAYFQ